ncbi:MAG TPA: XRE family transcriptional regulator [Acidimicrobiales bacterium]|nr:XRE family transcriptional regulator [Acidimicrobiales bacterium]
MAPAQLVSEHALSSIGERLKAAREQAGYTLDELASLTGLSKAHLSRLESAERQPSIAALLTFAAALRVPVGRLLGEDDSDSSTPLSVYSGGEAAHELAGLNVVACSGYPGSGALEALRMTISPERLPGTPARHHGEEWAYVVSGTLVLDYDGRPYRVAAGSCAHFDAEHPHRLGAENVTTEVLVVAAQGPRGLWSAHR